MVKIQYVIQHKIDFFFIVIIHNYYEQAIIMNDRSRDRDDLIYYFINDNELLELINSDSSYTINDESEILCDSQSITFWDTAKITIME